MVECYRSKVRFKHGLVKPSEKAVFHCAFPDDSASKIRIMSISVPQTEQRSACVESEHEIVMRKSLGMKRKLAAECLESRQLLHGGGIGGEAPSTEDHVTAVFDRLDTNDDGVILVTEEGGDDISNRIWKSLAAADVEGSEAGVTADELTTHLEAQKAEHIARRDERRAAMQERIEEMHNRIKERMEGIADRVKEMADRIKEHQGNKDNGGGFNVTAMVDKLFERKDIADPETGEGDGLLSAEELGGWAERLADVAGEDGLLSKEELTTYTEAKIAERQERWNNRPTDGDGTAEDGGDDGTNEVAAASVRQTFHAETARRVRAHALRARALRS